MFSTLLFLGCSIICVMVLRLIYLLKFIVDKDFPSVNKCLEVEKLTKKLLDRFTLHINKGNFSFTPSTS